MKRLVQRHQPLGLQLFRCQAELREQTLPGLVVTEASALIGLLVPTTVLSLAVWVYSLFQHLLYSLALLPALLDAVYFSALTGIDNSTFAISLVLIIVSLKQIHGKYRIAVSTSNYAKIIFIRLFDQVSCVFQNDSFIGIELANVHSIAMHFSSKQGRYMQNHLRVPSMCYASFYRLINAPKEPHSFAHFSTNHSAVQQLASSVFPA